MAIRKLWILPVLVIAGLAGCGQARINAVDSAAPAAPPPALAAPECPSNAAEVTADPQRTNGPLPADFRVSWVLRCAVKTQTLPGRGEWTVLVSERADTSADRLVAELRKPSDPVKRDQVCLMIKINVPHFTLVDASGRTFRPTVPTDSCGQPRMAALKALDGLTFRTTSTRPLKQIQSQGAVTTGCPQDYKDMLALSAESARPAPARPLWSTPAVPLTLCRYGKITRDPAPSGTFVSGRGLTAAEIAALDSTGPAAPCRATHTRFAVITGKTVQPAYAELDGCRRLLRPDGTVGQLSPALAAGLGR